MSLTITHAGVAQTSTRDAQGQGHKVIRITPTMTGATGEFVSGDTLTPVLVELPNAVDNDGGISLLQGMSVFNKDNADCALGIVFFENNSTPAFGTINAAPSISDADFLANNPLGSVELNAVDQTMFGGNRFGTAGGATDDHEPNQLFLQAAAGSTSVYFAMVARTTTTFDTATDISLIFNIKYV